MWKICKWSKPSQSFGEETCRWFDEENVTLHLFLLLLFYSFVHGNISLHNYTTQKMKFFIRNFLSKCAQILNFLRIWSDVRTVHPSLSLDSGESPSVNDCLASTLSDILGSEKMIQVYTSSYKFIQVGPTYKKCDFIDFVKKERSSVKFLSLRETFSGCDSVKAPTKACL